MCVCEVRCACVGGVCVGGEVCMCGRGVRAWERGVCGRGVRCACH